MKILVLNYSFDASAKQITFTDYNPIVIERVLLITNITDNVIIYNFANPALGGTAATNVLTLTYDTASMSDTDKLQIFYDDAATTQPISGTATVTQGTATNLKTQSEAYQGGSAVAVGNPLEVKLPAATVSTLTPPAAITGFATSAKQLADGHSVALSATDNAVLDAIQVGTDKIIAAPATAAKQLADGHTVALSATDNAVLDAIEADTTVIAGAVAATHMQCDVLTVPTVTVNAHAVTVASGGVASGAIASGAIASGALAAGSIASGAAVAGSLADGALVTLGAKADAKSTATDATAITAMQVLKQISASVQAPPSQAVTNAGTFVSQENGAALTALQLIDNCISGSEAQVDIVAALPAGANAIGKLASNSGVDIGDVDVTSAVITGGATAHDAADAGNPIKIGGRASTTPITAVAANDRVDAFFDVQGRQVVVNKALTGTITAVDASVTNVTVLAANTARLGATVMNDSTSILYLKLAATASATSYTVKMEAGAYFEVPFGYYGIIDGIWVAADGHAVVTQLT